MADFQDEKKAVSSIDTPSSGSLNDVKGVSSPARSASFSHVSISEELGGKKDEYGSTPDHVFSVPAIAAHWAEVYERAGYENRHRFDPSFQWDASEERKLVRKIDFRIMFWAWIMFCSLDLHRKNINRAISDDMLPELGMSFMISPFLVTELVLTRPRNEHKRLQLWSNHFPRYLLTG